MTEPKLVHRIPLLNPGTAQRPFGATVAPVPADGLVDVPYLRATGRVVTLGITNWTNDM